MTDLINQFNVKADRNTYGKWKDLNAEYFGDPETVKALFGLFERANISFPQYLEIVDFGSAEGLVGEYFRESLSKDYKVRLTLVDVVEEHLKANTNPETIKIHQDILTFSHQNSYDLGITRSLLHYFAKEDQQKVLRNIFNSLKDGGYFLLQAFVQREEDLELFLKLNEHVGKKLQLVPLEQVSLMLEEAGFQDLEILGDAPTWSCTSENLKLRYSLSAEKLKEMVNLIRNAPEEKKQGFTLSGDSFTVPVPFKVILARKLN